MRLLSWLKKPKKDKCRHYKSAGRDPLTNMVDVIRFDDYGKSKSPLLPYGVSQCRECGKRAFSCHFYHCMGSDETKAIDSFISYEITLEELLVLFDTWKFKYEAM